MKHANSETLPYAPSFLDRFMNYIEGLPIPYWLTYLALFILEVLLNHILAWFTGWLPVFTFNSLALIFPVWLWGPLAIMTHLRSVSQEALDSFSPLLKLDEGQFNGLKYEFATMPTRSLIISGLAWAIFYSALMFWSYKSFYPANGIGTFLSVIFILEGLISFSIGSAIYYYSLRQLSLVNRTVKMVKQFSLFDLNPIYAFSRVTSRIGVAWMLLLSSTLVLYPISIRDEPTIAMLVMQIVLAITAFVLPLWFVNRRLVAEKLRLLAEHDQRVEAALGRLHRSLDENGSGDAEQQYYSMTALTTEQTLLASIPTWPWRTGTLAGFLSAIGLPIILFLLQLGIEKWFGG